MVRRKFNVSKYTQGDSVYQTKCNHAFCFIALKTCEYGVKNQEVRSNTAILLIRTEYFTLAIQKKRHIATCEWGHFRHRHNTEKPE